ncbi:penicillin-binding protein 2 [Tannerella forsythia]|uniref:Penicillin-binding protein 2 n=1 Tax=Tannerella forsythia TaxID=28112 RepID=A0A3P1YNF4_TANFO|nr:penicillin-binding protein 2 [Tannerella forsythia]RRD72574.1 penicillin-binding protein 2 [Tannerella forsythia]
MENPKTKYAYEIRRFIIIGGVIFVILIYVVRLFFLQLVNVEYKASADNNAFLKKTLYPARGVIYDRNDKLLVYNQPAYDVMLIMREIQPFDTLDFCRTVGITKEIFDKRIADIKNRALNPGYSSYVPQVFMNQLSTNEYGILQEKLYKFPGFYIQNRTVREYTYPNAALLLGNIGEVNRRDIRADDYYVQGDYAGRAGVERSYEKVLRGEKGVEILLRDAHGRIKGRYEEGLHDMAPVSGKNLKLSIDIELQIYAEQLLHNKLGSIVMIEPSTGEVLCLATSPSYDPNLLVGRQRGKNHLLLENDPLKPLFDRSIMGTYPPGSTFKTTQGLTFLQEGVITPERMYSCARGYTFRGGKPACHGHGSPLALVPAIATSCNSYFCWGLHDMLDSRKRYPTVQDAFEKWKGYMVSMGFGYQLGIDLPSEQRGYIPNSKVYDKYYRGRWNSSTIISIAIGQGEILTTPLQICNLASTIANRGYYIVPHVVKEIEDTALDSIYTNRKQTLVDTKHYEVIAQGMRAAVVGGTCRGLNIKDVEVCGKTGTAENPHGKDHSACMAFAPYHEPKVAIAVYVENGGFGATIAVPMARLMLERYFYGEVTPESKGMYEDRILNTVILPSHVP